MLSQNKHFQQFFSLYHHLFDDHFAAKKNIKHRKIAFKKFPMKMLWKKKYFSNKKEKKTKLGGGEKGQKNFFNNKKEEDSKISSKSLIITHNNAMIIVMCVCVCVNLDIINYAKSTHNNNKNERGERGKKGRRKKKVFILWSVNFCRYRTSIHISSSMRTVYLLSLSLPFFCHAAELAMIERDLILFINFPPWAQTFPPSLLFFDVSDFFFVANFCLTAFVIFFSFFATVQRARLHESSLSLSLSCFGDCFAINIKKHHT